MNLRSLTSLAICTATVATASTLWASPAHAILLRFTGFSFNDTAVSFDYDSDITELPPSEDEYTGFIENFSYEPLEFPLVDVFLEEAPLLVSSPISSDLRFQIDDPSVFGNREYTINFGEISTNDFDGSPLTLIGSYSFVLPADPIQDSSEIFALLEFNDKFSGSRESVTFFTPEEGVITIEEIEGVASVPEARNYVGLALIGLLGVTQLGRKRFKAA